jgi:hypothetical protein
MLCTTIICGGWDRSMCLGLLTVLLRSIAGLRPEHWVPTYYPLTCASTALNKSAASNAMICTTHVKNGTRVHTPKTSVLPQHECNHHALIRPALYNTAHTCIAYTCVYLFSGLYPAPFTCRPRLITDEHQGPYGDTSAETHHPLPQETWNDVCYH